VFACDIFCNASWNIKALADLTRKCEKLHHTELYTVNVLLTYAMEQSPFWEANWFAASQEIPRISRTPKGHYRTYKCPPPVSILGQPNPVHMPTLSLFVCCGMFPIETFPPTLPEIRLVQQFTSGLFCLQSKHPACEYFITKYFTRRGCWHLTQPPSWRTTPRRLSVTAYSIYSQLPSFSEAVPLSATWGCARDPLRGLWTC